MSPELPGFYFDRERNRYFAIGKGGRRGQSRCASTARNSEAAATSWDDPPASSGSEEAHAGGQVSGVFPIVRGREVGAFGTPYASQRRFLEAKSSAPRVWTYEEVPLHSDSSLLWVPAHNGTLGGGGVLFTGSANHVLGAMALLPAGGEDGSVTRRRRSPNLSSRGSLAPLGRAASEAGPPPPNPEGPSAQPPVVSGRMQSMKLHSPVTSVRPLCPRDQLTMGGHTLRILATTLGAEGRRGALWLGSMQADSWDPAASPATTLLRLDHARQVSAASIWTAECSPRGDAASLGTSDGALLCRFSDGGIQQQALCRGRSACLAQQFDSTGNIVLCGFRNGAISTIDVRLPPPRHGPVGGVRGRQHRRGGAVLGAAAVRAALEVPDMFCSHSPVMRMTSSVCSMALLRSDENYLLAGAMDGSLQRWDRRMTAHAVQDFEGHVNTHTRAQLALDATEALLFAGGEDNAVRIWSLATGRLLSCARGFSAPPTAISCADIGNLCREDGVSEARDVDFINGRHAWSVWVGGEYPPIFMHSAAASC